MAAWIIFWSIGLFYNFKMRQSLKRLKKLGLESRIRSLRLLTFDDLKILINFFKPSDQDSFEVNAEKSKIYKYIKIQISIGCAMFFMAGLFLLSKI